MEAIRARLEALTVRQRMIAGVGAAAIIAVTGTMLSLSGAEDDALLYAGLSPEASGDIIALLDGESVEYDVRGGGIFVPASQRDRLRMVLAQNQLPRPTSDGYELLDELDGFSTTSDMFSVTYWRAKEGELARTLLTIPGVEAARVHIGAGQESAFSRARNARTASVALTASSPLSDGQVDAVRYLTALAVPGLATDDVAVIDSARGVLTSNSDDLGAGERNRAQALERSLLSLLEARVGVGNARVSVAMDVNRNREEIATRQVDPDSQVVMSQTREDARSTEEGMDRAVTVASDLPDGEAANNQRSSDTQETREETSYAVSTTDRRLEVMPGGVERLSVAVLINDVPDEEGNLTPREPVELEALGALVTAAAGINEARGDFLTIRSMPFDASAASFGAAGMAGTGPTPAGDSAKGLPWLPIGGGAILLAGFAAFILRPLMSKKSASGDSVMMIDGDVAFEDASIVDADPVERLRERSRARPQEAAALLNAWLDEDEKEPAA